MTEPNPADVQDIVERLRRQARLMPILGNGSALQGGSFKSVMTDSGMRFVNPDGPAAADEIERLRAALQRSRSAVTDDMVKRANAAFGAATKAGYFPGEAMRDALEAALSQESADA